MAHYSITDWDLNYEVDKDNRVWKPGKAFFQGPLAYIRVTARRDWNVRLLMVRELAGEEVWAIVGAFEKLCQIVGCEERALREGGVVRNSKHEPASLREISRMLLWSEEKTSWALGILCNPDVGWLAPLTGDAADEHNSEPSEDSRESAKPAETCELPPNSASSQDKNKSRSRDNYNSITAREDALDLDVPFGQEDFTAGTPAHKCFDILCANLKPSKPEQLSGLRHIVTWTRDTYCARAGPRAYNDVIGVAKDCMNAELPIAAFYVRMQKDFGYEPPSKKQKGKLACTNA